MLHDVAFGPFFVACLVMGIQFFTNCKTYANSHPSSNAPSLELLSASCGDKDAFLQELHQSPSDLKEKDAGGELLVFISFNLPPATLQALIDQTTQAGGVLVVRGLVNGSFQETAKRIQELGAPIHIDPPLFERFAVQSVPTFILTKPLSREESVSPVPHDRIAGNISLMHALTLFEEKGDLASQARSYLRRLKEAS